jgi:PAS domain S-box-containing protein
MQSQLENNPFEHRLNKFCFGLGSSVFQNHPTPSRRLNFLDIILSATIIAVAFIILGEILGSDPSAPILGLNFLTGFACLGLGYWVHKSSAQWGGLIFLGLVFIYNTCALVNFGTAQSPAGLGYLFLIVGAGILFDQAGIGIAFILSVLAILGLMAAEKSGVLLARTYALTLTHWSLYAALASVAGGILIWMFLSVRQVLERVEHQKAELEASPVSIIITDSEGRIEYVNPKYTQVMGYTLEEVRAKKTPLLQLEQMPPGTYSELRATLLAGRVWHGEFQNQTKSGESFFASYTITPVADAMGRVTHFVIAIKDISERKRIEAERRALNRALEFGTLYEITYDLGTFTDLPVLFNTILKRVESILDVYAGAIYLFDSTRREFDLVSEIGTPLELGSPVPAKEWLVDVPPQIHMNTASTVRVPILYADECLGMLIMGMMRPNHSITEKPNLNLLALLATQIASAIHNLTLFEQVRASRARAQVLAKEILSTQESERRLIARELHDQFGQELSSVQLGLQAIQRLMPNSNGQAKLNDVMGTIEHVLEQMRDLSRILRPSVLDDFGLVPALEWYIEQQILCDGLHAEIIADHFEERLREEVETVCFRIVQEAVTNVVRHARATRVVIELHLRDAQVELTIKDNGVGFSLTDAMTDVTQGKSLGLLSMHERVELIGGRMQISTAPGQGTQIDAHIPLNQGTPIIARRSTKRSEN